MFGGGRSIKLVNVLGIRIGVNPSWFLVLFLIIYALTDQFQPVLPGNQTGAFLLGTLAAVFFFASVLLHELGHAVVARRNGIEIAGIDLWLFGGVAKMRRDATSPGVEFRVAVAGPLVTLVIALACTGLALLLTGTGGFRRAFAFDAGADVAGALLAFLVYINTVLLLFNLLPGLPLDGGRIARAAAWKLTGDRVKGTRFAALIGRGFGFALMALGVYLLLRERAVISGVWMIFLGLFLGQAARATEAQARFSSRLDGLRVADVMDDEPVAIPAGTTLDRAYDEFFLRYGWPWFPVVDEGGRLLGVLTAEQVEAEPEETRGARAARDLVTAATASLRIGQDEPLEALLGSEGLQRLGALMAVDAQGILRGVVTLDRVQRALRPATTTA